MSPNAAPKAAGKLEAKKTCYASIKVCKSPKDIAVKGAQAHSPLTAPKKTTANKQP